MDDYYTRLDRTGRALSLGPVAELEVEDKKNLGMAAEAVLLERAIPAGALIATLDERGEVLSSARSSPKCWQAGAMAGGRMWPL